MVVESLGSDGLKPILRSRLKDPSFEETSLQRYKQGRIQATADIYAADLTQCYIDFMAQFQVPGSFGGTNFARARLVGFARG